MICESEKKMGTYNMGTRAPQATAVLHAQDTAMK